MEKVAVGAHKIRVQLSVPMQGGRKARYRCRRRRRCHVYCQGTKEGRRMGRTNGRQSLVRSRSHHPTATAGSKLRMSNALGKHITHAARSLVSPLRQGRRPGHVGPHPGVGDDVLDVAAHLKSRHGKSLHRNEGQGNSWGECDCHPIAWVASPCLLLTLYA